MPHIESRAVIEGFDSRDLSWVGYERILQARLPGLRPARCAAERLTGEHLELHLVDVDRVGVLGEVVDLPQFDGSERDLLRDWRIPPQRVPVPSGLSVPSMAAIGPSKRGWVDPSSLSETWRVAVCAPGFGGAGN